MSYFNASFQTPQGGDVKLLDADGSASISLKANDTTTSYTLKFPAAVGTSGQVLRLADGSGGLEFATTSSSVNADDIGAGDAPVLITTDNGNITLQASTSNAIILNDGSNNVVTVQSDVVTVTGNITMDAANSIQFRDSALSINSSADGQLDIDADTTLQITAPTANVTGNLETSGTLDVSGVTNINNTTESTVATTGALIVDGGVGVAKQVRIGSSTGSTTSSTGALVVTGGVGVGENLNVNNNLDVGGTMTVAGNLTVNGETTFINSNVATIDDPVIELGNADITAVDTKDRGLVLNVYDGANNQKQFFGWDRNTSAFAYYSNVTVAGDIVTPVTRGSAVFAGLTLGGNGNEFTITESSDIITMDVATSDKDLIFTVNDGGSTDTEVYRLDAANASIKVASANKINFRDDEIAIHSSADGQLDIDADTTLQITAPTSTFSAAVTVGGAVNIDDTTESTVATTGALIVDGGVGVAKQVRVGSSTGSTTSSTGALVVTGGVGVGQNLNIAGTLTSTGAVNIDDTTQSTSTSTGALIVDGGAGIAKNLTVGGNTTVSGNFIVGMDRFTSLGATTAARSNLFVGSNVSTIKSIEIEANASFASIPSGDNGQMLHLFYTNNTAAGNTQIDFGADNLYAGSGTAQYLEFTQSGQSATLVFINGTNGVAGWRIINTGATIS